MAALHEGGEEDLNAGEMAVGLVRELSDPVVCDIQSAFPARGGDESRSAKETSPRAGY